MDNRLFREVLADCMAEKSEDSPAHPSAANPPPAAAGGFTPYFQWRAPDFGRLKTAAYTKVTAAPPTAKPTPTAPPEERRLPISRMKPLDQADALLLVHLGASELRDGISPKILKKAYRRLIKKLHPDRWEQGITAAEQGRLQDQFLQLQSAYEGLSRSLSSYGTAETSGSTSGNESASAPDYRRRDAA